MKSIIMSLLLFISIFSIGQVKVTYNYQQPYRQPSQNEISSPQPFFILNGKHLTHSIEWINPSDIKAINVIKKDTIILGKKSPFILITLKDSIQLSMISLTEIKKKYVKTNTSYVIYFINGKLIYETPEESSLNENSILSISVDKIKSKDPETGRVIDIDVIEILTKTKENIEKSKEIRLR